MLSQAEIDALLSGQIEPENEEALAATEHAAETTVDGEKHIRLYNFWSPNRFSKEQLRAVELVHEELAERLATSMPALVRSEVRPRVVHIEQGRFDDLTSEISNTTLYNIIAFDPLPGRSILTISPEITWVMLDKLLGGQQGPTANITPSPLTDIGQTLIRGSVEDLLPDIKAAWNKVAALDLHLDDATVNKMWVSMLMRNARVVLISLEVVIQEVTGSIDIYIPFATLKPIIKELTPTAWMAGREQTDVQPPETQRALNAFISESRITLSVILGRTTLTMAELTALNPDDVLRLDTTIGQPLTMCVGNTTSLYQVVPGTSGSHLAVQVVDNL